MQVAHNFGINTQSI